MSAKKRANGLAAPDIGEATDATDRRTPRLFVGIGASAGGLDACKRFLAAMPSDSGMAFVIVMHLDPKHESRIAQLFRAVTEMDVVQVSETQALVPNRVYVIAPDSSLEVRHGAVSPRKPHDRNGRRRNKPVDALFTSLAEDQRELAVAIVLSGTGNNGSAGIHDIKRCGGLCLAQNPEAAEFDGMPRNAIATGVVDHVLPPEEMPGILIGHAKHPGTSTAGEEDLEQAEPSEAFEGILDLLSRTYEVKFRTSYKRGTLQRRTKRRMALKHVSGWAKYLELLESDPKEVASLYADLLIGVTRFFRDPGVWEQLESEVIPGLFERHAKGLPLKIWVPGCATGEEPYSLAIAFLEHRERLNRATKVQVFATDVAEDAVAFARRGIYPSTIQDSVSPERLSQFFHRRGDCFEISRDVRDSVTFAIHNLLADPPFSQLDLVSCRNVLIYLESHAQHKVMELFHFALKPGGLLLLGASETVGRHRNLFETVSESARLYRSVGTAEAIRNRHLRWIADRAPSRGAGVAPPSPGGGGIADRAPSRGAGVAPPSPGGGAKISRAIERLVLSRHTEACVAITESFEIQAFFGPTHDYLVQPTGEARMDLLAWAHPGLYPRLRSALEKAREQNEHVEVTEMRIERGDTTALVECTVDPITPLPGEARMFLVSFRDMPRSPAPELDRPAESGSEAPLVRRLETELKGTRDELRGAIQQLDSANNEYSATTAELLSLNEELQSSNEELETSKEELQSLNEEMETINQQLEDKNRELRTAYNDLNNLVASTNIPIIFLDRDLRVRRFTPAATKLMRLTPSDIGRSIEHIKERFQGGDVFQDARKVLEEHVPITAEVRTHDGRWYARDVLPYRSELDRIDGVCIAFQDVTNRKKAAQEIDEARLYAEAIVSTVRIPLVVLDGTLRVVSANESFYTRFRVTAGETEGRPFFDLGNHQWDIPRLRVLLEDVLPEKREVQGYEIEHDFVSVGRRTMRLNASLMRRQDRPHLILLVIEDVTEQKAAERITSERASELSQESQRKDRFLAMLGHELRNPLSALLHGIDLLGGKTGDAAQLDDVRQMMKRQAKRIGGMLDQLLDVARLTAGKIRIARAPVDMSEAVRAAAEAVTPLIEARRHELIISLPPGGGVIVEGDLDRLTQVAENLIVNAAKYTEEGGRIELSLESDTDSVVIRARDNGIGIDADLLPHIFELFTQGDRALDRAGGGLGLGLPLIKSVVEMHGGRIEASSPGHGHGSEFVVTLPRMRERRAEQRGDGAGSDPGTKTPRRILVVDDEADNATMLARILAMEGHESLAVYDGPAALEAARSFHPDVALLDLGLPKMDGYKLARQLRDEHGEKLLLIALTGYQKDTDRLKQAGFDHHLIKPADLEDLSRLLAVSGRRPEPRTDGASPPAQR